MITRLTLAPNASDFSHASEAATNPFTSHSDVLAVAEEMFDARRQWQRATADDPKADTDIVQRLERNYRVLRAEWHARCETSDLPICRRCVECGLTSLERELLWGSLSLNTSPESGSSRRSSPNVAAVIAHIATERRDRLTALTLFSPDSALVRHQWLHIREDGDEEPGEAAVIPAASVLDELFDGRRRTAAYWTLEHEHELYHALRPLYSMLDANADACRDYHRRNNRFAAEAFWDRSIKRNRQWDRLFKTLERHPTWSWNRLEVESLDRDEVKILITLAAAALDMVSEEYELFTGRGLISTLVDRVDAGEHRLRLLSPACRLIRDEWVRPATGNDDHCSCGDDIAMTRFELGDHAYEVLALERADRQTVAGVAIREPSITLANLALSPSIEQAIRLTVTQARAESTFLKDWGLVERIQYGLHPVLLFYGPPGTGKTATAEALAHELKRPLIVADYSKIQNAYVGHTEKNIVRIFREARRRKAVLFWDEADAMLFDRDDAVRSWEVRDVNVILQQIERFKGVCILATNRHKKLDKALARRISMQVEFKRPETASERLRIWRSMLPPQLPLAADVDLESLAEEDLSGGEMKNVLLNAARFAAAREEPAPRLTSADFAEAVRWETYFRQARRARIGFRRVDMR